MSTPVPVRNGQSSLPHSRASSIVSSSRPSSPNGVQSKHHSSRQSSAIMTGADRLLSLVEQEINRAAAQNQVKLDDLQARFDDFRKQAADEQQRLADRVRVLEAELALKAADVASTTKSSSESNSRDDALLDVDTVNLLRSLASLVKAAESTMKEKGAESTTIDTSHFPASWLPTLAQYIAYHKKKFQELQQRQSAIEQERDRLLEDMISKSRQSPLPTTVNPAATMSNPYRPVHTR